MKESVAAVQKSFATSKLRRGSLITMDRLGPKPVYSSRGRNVGNVCPSMASGMDHIRNPRLFKGMAFNLEERQALGNSY